jgi:hypothetical protein
MALTMMIALLVGNAYTQTATDAATQAPSSHVRMYKVHLKPGVPYSAPAGAHLTYYGGRVVSNIQVVLVFWGSNVSSEVQSKMPDFYDGVLNSAYVDWLDPEYNTVNSSFNGTQTNQHIGKGSFLQKVTITPSDTSTTIDDTAIQTELVAQIKAGNLPAPTTDAAGNTNTYYAVFFPAGMKITMGGSSSCTNFCAYHGTIPAFVGLGEMYYSVHPDLGHDGCELGCGGASTAFDNTTSLASHQLIETITDPEVGLATTYGPPLAWYDTTNGEIGDICNGQQGTITAPNGVIYTVQKEFSNFANDCIVSNPQDFSISASPASVSVAAGNSGTSTISTAVTSGSAESISLSVSGAPSGVTASLNPTSVTSGQSSTLTFAVGSSAPSSTSTVTVTGTGSGTSHSAGVTLVVIGGSGVINGGFETGSLYGWVPNGANVGLTGTAHSGSYAAMLGSTTPTNGNNTLSQTFTAPSGTTTLSFYYAASCPTNVQNGWVMVTLTDNTVAMSRNIVPKTCPTSFVWTQAATGIVAGHSYTLTFINHDQNLPGNAVYSVYDDVTLK